jgi:hypothetical protein
VDAHTECTTTDPATGEERTWRIVVTSVEDDTVQFAARAGRLTRRHAHPHLRWAGCGPWRPLTCWCTTPSLLATVDDARREIAGGWVAVTGGGGGRHRRPR